ANETFTVNLSNPVNGAIASGGGTGTGTIIDDDPAPSLSINDVSVLEGNSGTTNAVSTVTISAPSGLAAQASFATADGPATAGSDYQAQSGTLSFAPGTTAQTVTVAVNGDIAVEADETFSVNLSNAVNATIARGTGTGTIVNDDANSVVQFSAASYTVAENA